MQLLTLYLLGLAVTLAIFTPRMDKSEKLPIKELLQRAVFISLFWWLIWILSIALAIKELRQRGK